MKKSFRIFRSNGAGFNQLKVAGILSLVLCMGLASGCTIDENESSGDRTDYYIHYDMYYRYLQPVYRLAQDVNFFTQYRDVLQESETGAESFSTLFLNAINNNTREYELDADHMFIRLWGTVAIGDADGEYIGIPYNAEDGLPQFSIIFTDEDSFEISCEHQTDERFIPNSEFDFKANVKFTDDSVEWSGLTLNYSETVDGEVLNINVVGSDTLTGRLWKDFPNYSSFSSRESPMDGTLYYTLSGKYNFTFRTEYWGDVYRVISADGYIVEI